ncbi:methyltransferase domain-containing protein [Chitinispirillales bacterium ANBcel5]|uniref:methyltransferase domain-containing protein n=1 Tax=Cellulosispirillum alkaliphilum TaxID=3039283 RepID=UPI002A53B257|nr:methyltransferase domain-containing protein [Chitinispirillales bacterium ANBcel5]
MNSDHSFVDSKYLQSLADKIRPVKIRSYELMNLKPDSIVLDVGCGPGIDTATLFTQKVNQGIVVGVDIDSNMVKAAQNATKDTTRIGYFQANSYCLPFSHQSFDSVRSERLLQHLDQPQCAIAEMKRVCRKNGIIVVVDCDHSSLSIDTTQKDIEWKLRRSRTEQIPNGYSGRNLFRLLKKQGLCGVAIELHTIAVHSYHLFRKFSCMDEAEQKALSSGCITENELIKLNEELIDYDKKGVFTAYTVFIIASGKRKR